MKSTKGLINNTMKREGTTPLGSLIKVDRLIKHKNALKHGTNRGRLISSHYCKFDDHLGAETERFVSNNVN